MCLSFPAIACAQNNYEIPERVSFIRLAACSEEYEGSFISVIGYVTRKGTSYFLFPDEATARRNDRASSIFLGMKEGVILLHADGRIKEIPKIGDSPKITNSYKEIQGWFSVKNGSLGFGSFSKIDKIDGTNMAPLEE